MYTTTSIAILALGLVACSTAGPSTAGPSTAVVISSTSSVSSAPPPLAFESTRHRYSIDVPAGWHVTQYEGTWTSLEQFGQGVEVPGEDVVSPRDLSSFLVINSMAIPDPMSAAEWRAAFDALVAAETDPNCPATPGADRVDSELAKLLTQPCDGSILIGRRLTHGGRGYYFTIRYPAGETATKTTLDKVVASVRFIDD